MALERVDDVHGGDGVALRVLGVGDGVADHSIQEGLQHGARLLVDQVGDALHSSAAGEASDGRVGDALDVLAHHLLVSLASSGSVGRRLLSLALAWKRYA